MQMKKKQGKEKAIPVCIAAGVAAGIVVTLCLASVCAALLGAERVSETAIPFMIYGTLVLSSAAGGITACILTQHQRLVTVMASCVTYELFLILGNVLLFEGRFHRLGTATLAILGSGLAVCFVYAAGKGSHKKRVRKYRFG